MGVKNSDFFTLFDLAKFSVFSFLFLDLVDLFFDLLDPTLLLKSITLLSLALEINVLIVLNIKVNNIIILLKS